LIFCYVEEFESLLSLWSFQEKIA